MTPTAPTEDDAFVKAAILRCRERVGLKHESLAALMGISPSQLSMQLQPGGHVSITRLLHAAKDDDGRRFLQMFWTSVAEHVGLDDSDAVVQELKRLQGRIAWLADRFQVRMAKAELREVQRRHGAA